MLLLLDVVDYSSNVVVIRTRYCNQLIEMKAFKWRMMERPFSRQLALIILLPKCLLVRHVVFASAHFHFDSWWAVFSV